MFGASPLAKIVYGHKQAGISPKNAGRRLLLVLQAFIDDSYSEGGYFVLAGHIASAEAWAAFAKEWEEILPYGVLNKYNKYHFKMSEMALLPERFMRVGAFYRIIEKHVLASISCRFKPLDLIRAKNRIWIPNQRIDYGFVNNTYMFAFRALMDMFHSHKRECDQFIPYGETVDFIFDEQTERRPIISAWDEYIANRPDHIRNLFGTTPRFENDTKFLPLQASDLWAWWVRKWSEDGTIGQNLKSPNFIDWTAKREYPKIDISFDEDQLAKTFIDWAKPYINPGTIIL
jgi:Protein of unknown function (DUF3800)